MLELKISTSNNQMFSTLSECPKLEQLTLSASLRFSLCGLSLMKSLTTLEMHNFQDQDVPAPHSLPNMKNLNIRTHDNEVCISFLAACPNLQSLTVSLNQEFASQEIDRFIQNCSNLEIFKLTTDYKKLNSVKTNFQDLSTFSPKIQFLQL